MQVIQTDNKLKEIDDLNKEGWNLNRKDPVKAIELGQLALKKSQELGYKSGIALALKTIGAGSTWLSRHDDAMKFNFEAVELFSELGDKINEAETNYTIGASFVYISDFDTGIKHYNKCYVISKEIGDELGMANGLNGIGTVYYRINENHKALEVLNESKILCEKHQNIDIYIKVLDGIGEAYYNLKQYELALEYYIKCAKLSNEVKNKQVEAFALDGLGRTYAALNESEKAIDHFNKSVNLRREIGFKAGEVVSLLNIGIFYTDKGQLDDGAKYIEQSLELALNINSKEGQYKAYEGLAKIHELKKDYKKSIEYYKLFFTTKNEIITETTNQVIRSGEMQRKVLQDQAEKLILEERSKDLENYTDNLILLGEIGQKIISQINVGSIVDMVYEHVNKLMDAPVFGIGIYNKEANQVQFPLLIERGGKFNDRKYNLSDKEKFAVICYSQSKEIIIGNLLEEYSKYVATFQPAVYGKDSSSILYLPLIVKDKTIGVITVQSYTINAYSQYQINIFRNLASYTAIALDNANLYEEQEKKITERTQEVLLKKEEVERAYHNNKILSELGQQITSTLNFEDIFSKLNQYVGGLMDAPIFSIRLLDTKTHSIIYKYRMENGKRNDIISVSLNDIDNYSVWCVTNKKEIFINDNQNEYHKYTKKIIVVSGEMPHSLIFYPIILGDKVLGCITVQSFEKFAYTDYHLDILKTLATYTAIAIENANLFEIMEERVNERTSEVVKQKAIIEEKNKDITDSIKYAKKIQQAIMPDERVFSENFIDNYVLYKPKDIVSGDFYWFENVHDDLLVFAVADCTGHGVPGAFMSLINNNIMNIVFRDRKVTTPGYALSIVDLKLREILSKSSDRGANDGMDIALCALHKQTNKLQYAGANRPLFISRNGELIEYKPTKLSIGGSAIEGKHFISHEIQLEPNDQIYLFTDGFADQFGGPKGKKYKTKNLLNTLKRTAKESMAKQKEILYESFKNWKGNLEQVDDVLIIGLKI